MPSQKSFGEFPAGRNKTKLFAAALEIGSPRLNSKDKATIGRIIRFLAISNINVRFTKTVSSPHRFRDVSNWNLCKKKGLKETAKRRGERRTANSERQTANGDWTTVKRRANGEWQKERRMANVKRQTTNSNRRMTNGKG